MAALISAIGDIPLRQELAVTGSLNQQGEVQAIGGVNEKIEGFFEVCEARGLTGDQGVVIPAANTVHLMLREPVRTAVSEGRFHIYAVERIDDALALLTGVDVGAIDAAVNARLEELTALARRYARHRDDDDKDGDGDE
jgi:predicted ATP-dependent protease